LTQSLFCDRDAISAGEVDHDTRARHFWEKVNVQPDKIGGGRFRDLAEEGEGSKIAVA